MNQTGYRFAGHELAGLSVGCMRFPSREAAAEVIATAVRRGVRYLDTAPLYCYRSEEENTETWTGAAIADLRDEVILSAKCSPGNGGNGVGEYDPARGFSIGTADQVRRQIDQSLRRLNVERFDCYQMWAIHVPELFDIARRPGGWLEGALQARAEGLFTHFGITGHADADEIRRWVDSGLFELITVPFHILDTSRWPGIAYALEHGVAVLAMNPLAGGLLGGESDVLCQELAEFGITSAADLALRYLLSHGVSALSGMTNAAEVEANVAAAGGPLWPLDAAEAARATVEALMGQAKICTGCGYCLPCEQDLDIPGILKLRNYYTVLRLESARATFRGRYSWDQRFHADRCASCGVCEGRCPNNLPISDWLAEVMTTFGAGLA